MVKVTDEAVIAVMEQVDRIKKTVSPSGSMPRISVEEAYKLAALNLIASKLDGIDDSIMMSE
ncbi:hypothetical protein PQ472_09000 [Lacticaseibacillus pabuli]|uniref:Uncharacterized protein n=1 Tax=Lacticaseibacillus pabuli TaxID=3025672 RepID=A0ABY7WSW4_9LACO|nr:hypothetical protein [Lacticaseibacillus sp. KACC 23028]WDF82056.1 hypothetical protein PQ472_09000 [Lacticaseibacillus sp. KACC 23028]